MSTPIRRVATDSASNYSGDVWAQVNVETDEECFTHEQDEADKKLLGGLSNAELLREIEQRWANCDAVLLIPPEPGVRQLCASIGEINRRAKAGAL